MNTKRCNFYELDPRFFKDTTKNGIGDLQGLANKFDYFKFLGVDAIILKNITSIESITPGENRFIKIAPEIGSIDSLKKVIFQANKLNKKVLIDIPIGYINENHDWFKNLNQNNEAIINFKNSKDNPNLNYGFSNENQKFFVQDKVTMEIPLNWKSPKVQNQFLEVIRFWSNLGVSGFVFKDFEFLGNETKHSSMSKDTLRELRTFYRGIKEINDELMVVGRSLKLPLKTLVNYTEGPTKVFDYFMSETLAENGIHNKFGHDLIGKFNVKKLARDIKILANNPQNILTFDTEHIGKVVSRWGNDVQYREESAKTLSLLLQLAGTSSSIYQGLEIGATNIGLTHLDDFQDPSLEERRKNLILSKVSESDFLEAQVLQASINARALMAWDDSKDGGFSSAEKTVTPPSTNHKEVNVKNQYGFKGSVLNFNINLLKLINHSNYSNIICAQNIAISMHAQGVIQYTIKDSLKEQELILLANLSDKNKPVKRIKEGKVILSSYSGRKYLEIPKILDAYESVLITKYMPESLKKNNIVDLSETKEYEKLAVEAKKIEKFQAEQKHEAELDKVKAETLAKKEALLKQEAEQAALKRAQEEQKQAIIAQREAKAKEIELQIEAAKKEEAAMALAAKQAQDAQEKARLKAKMKSINNLDEKIKSEIIEQKVELQEDALENKISKQDIESAAKTFNKLDQELETVTDNLEGTTDISTKDYASLVHDINKAKEENFNNENPILAEDENHELIIDEETKVYDQNSDLAQAKKEAQADRSYKNLYQDEQTTLKEEELAKTILVEDEFDIDDLFTDKNK